jgi:hypothetical protein
VTQYPGTYLIPRSLVSLTRHSTFCLRDSAGCYDLKSDPELVTPTCQLPALDAFQAAMRVKRVVHIEREDKFVATRLEIKTREDHMSPLSLSLVHPADNVVSSSSAIDRRPLSIPQTHCRVSSR